MCVVFVGFLEPSYNVCNVVQHNLPDLSQDKQGERLVYNGGDMEAGNRMSWHSVGSSMLVPLLA